MVTLGKKWKAEGIEIGRKEGILEAIQLALEIKFGDEGLKIFPQIKEITSIEKLKEIKSALRSADSLNPIKSILSS